MEVLFEIPIEIKKGLEKGIYKRVGGVIVKAEGKSEVIAWLKEIPKSNVSNGNLLVKVTSLGKAALSAADYFYLHENFKKINQKLDNLDLKLNAQNLSKVKSGLILAAEAEKMNDKLLAKNQILDARSSLEEGSNILQHILADINKKEKGYKEKRMHYLNIIIQAELGIVRSYMLHKEYSLAKMRLLQLRQFLLAKCFLQIDDDINFHLAWYWYAVAMPLAIPTYAYTLATKKESKTVILNTELKKLKESTLEEEAKLELILLKTKEKNYKISEEVQTLVDFDDYLKGYVIELEHYEIENQIPDNLM